jgi:hypothetical protein
MKDEGCLGGCLNQIGGVIVVLVTFSIAASFWSTGSPLGVLIGVLIVVLMFVFMGAFSK